MSWLSKALGNPIQSIAGGLLGGLLAGKKGGGFTPTGAPLIDPFSQEQAKKLYEQTQSGLAQQQAFVNALAGQNALANQANVFRQLQDVASGVGPNPALAALQQATGQNIAAQSALMGGQRGGSRNVGLLARQAGMQGGALQQQAAGQGSTLQAQQQLGALGQLGGLANQQVGQLQTGLAGLNQYGLMGQQNILDAIARQNAIAAQQQAGLNQINAQIAADKAKQQGGLLGNIGQLLPIAGSILGGPVGGLLGSVASGLSNAGNAIIEPFIPGLNKGGEVPAKPNYALGGMTANQPQSYVGQYFQNPNQMLSALNQSDNLKEANLDYSTLADGGAVYRSGNYAEGGMAPKSLMIKGGHVPGKAVVKGDSYQNDIVDAKLSPGEIVIPRSIVNHPNAPEMAAKFVQETLTKKKGYANGGGVAGKDDIIKFDPELIKKYIQQPIEDQQEEQPAEPQVQERAPAAVEPPKKEPVSFEDYQSISPYSKGFQEQKAAYEQIGNLAKKQAEEEEKNYQQNLFDIQKQQEKYLNEISDVNNEMNNLRSDIMQTKLDPQRYYSNMSTGNKIATVIGLILGGVGASYTGGENPALKQLNQLVDQDIMAQKQELGKKENLLTALTQKYGNVNQAMQMARIMMNDSLSLQMKQIASRYAGRIEGQRLNAEIAKLDQNIAQQVDTFAKSRMYSLGRGSIPIEQDPYRAERVDIEGKPFYAESPQEAFKIKEDLNNINNALETIKKMKKLRTEVGSETFPTAAKEKGESLKNSLLRQAGPILLGQPLSKRNKELIESEIPDPTRYSGTKFIQSLNDLENELKQKKINLSSKVFRTPSFSQKNKSFIQPTQTLNFNPKSEVEEEE